MMSFEGFNSISCNNTNSSAVVSATVPSSVVSLLPVRGKMNGHGDIGLGGESFDPGFLGRLRDDEYESRSGSDNFDAVSGDDQEARGQDKGRKKKKYHRHTPHQIQELESFFKECPHPDEKQRLELSRRLALETKQIKFWFQNRRTQMKTQLERHENVILRQENEKLLAENDLLKEAMRSPVCNACGGPAVPGDVTYEQQHLRFENARLKDELARISSLANKFLGRPVSSLVGPPPQPSGLDVSILGLATGINGGISSDIPLGIDFGDGHLMKPPGGNDIVYERSMFVDLALKAMDELIKLADPDCPLWIKNTNSEKESLNHDEYRSVYAGATCTRNPGFAAEASRETGVVLINSLALVETLMDANRWTEMFESIVARASTIDVISSGTGGSMNGCLQLMQAEFQVISPLVPTRQVKFLRYCKQHADGLWAVVDVSSDINRDGPNLQSYGGCRRLPSGCIIQDMGNGYSKVTWVEHSEYDESNVHHLYRQLLSSGLGLGAQRSLATLQRQCESFSALLSSLNPTDNHSGLTPAGAKSVLKLAQRMGFNFFAGVSGSSVRKWEKLPVANVGEDMRILTRKNVSDPGEPSGVILSAATSVWIPVAQHRLFDFLRDQNCRNQWDILSNGGTMNEMVRIPKGRQHDGNSVSLLRASGIDQTESSMLILQETWTDPSGAMVVYAPVDVSSMNVVMNGGDSAYVALLPSGFWISPDGSKGKVKNEVDGNTTTSTSNNNGGCILTVGFQILVNSLPNARLNMESVDTVNNLISCTIHKIKGALLQ
ncbi:PREDICTED: homeobox-leucine zipper protein HDG7-like isoform X2 [Tarenaya hassleriana]|uniref:homeobox-leucine zipper protein HDG7-like isoform X2 n=1 Tax=Tarenaya hassleriana TaxID=28532 RepID=UPI00053C56CE|nr:PREDICTED: homeobox-leucine zipper protein HDG7-like isoform X2 [Tarenaya hassleriana]